MRVYRAERFFDIQKVNASGERLRAAVLCLEGPALASQEGSAREYVALFEKIAATGGDVYQGLETRIEDREKAHQVLLVVDDEEEKEGGITRNTLYLEDKVVLQGGGGDMNRC
ncbi:hypothetical protein Tco_0162015 [Tanacetum coccineum]